MNYIDLNFSSQSELESKTPREAIKDITDNLRELLETSDEISLATWSSSARAYLRLAKMGRRLQELDELAEVLLRATVDRSDDISNEVYAAIAEGIRKVSGLDGIRNVQGHTM